MASDPSVFIFNPRTSVDDSNTDDLMQQLLTAYTCQWNLIKDKLPQNDLPSTPLLDADDDNNNNNDDLRDNENDPL